MSEAMRVAAVNKNTRKQVDSHPLQNTGDEPTHSMVTRSKT